MASNAMERFICMVIGYAFGLIQSSYFIGKRHHVDIRKVGSGNAGTTNALRSLGLKAGLLTLFMDVMKCVLAILLVRFLFKGNGKDILPLLSVYAGAGCVLGHNFPFFLGFRGGKGVAASLGLFCALDFRIVLVVMFWFFFIFFTTHYVSLASLSSYFFACALAVIFGALGFYGMDFAGTLEMDLVLAALFLLTVFRHRANISRLLSGTERKTYLTHNKKENGGEGHGEG